MHLITSLASAAVISLAAFASVTAAPAAPAAPATAAASDAGAVKAAQDLLAAMQAEKLVRSVAGSSRYPNEQSRAAAMAKIDKLAPADVYKRLAAPVSKLVSVATANEMARFYQSSYGQKVLKQQYNSGPSFGDSAPQATKEEKAELKKPAYIKASKELEAAQPAIRHEVFVLVKSLLAA
jgi:membrane-bound lytic murein transglycosylase